MFFRPSLRAVCLRAALTATLLTASAFAAAVNEVRISSLSDDSFSNFFEISGTPGESLDGLTMLSISGEFEPGEISFAFDLAGLSIPADGFFLASTDLIFYPGADYATGVDFFGSPQSFVLVDGFTGAALDDIDADNDGVPETTPWSSVVDAVSLIDGDANPDFSYGGGDDVGPDGDFPPAHAYRIADSTGGWVQGAFSDPSLDTPGISNVPEPATEILLLLSIAGLASFVRKQN